MSWAWRVARALLGSQYALMLEYRAEIALWALSGVLPLIMLGVWSGSGAAAAAGLSPQQLSHYFLAAFVVRQFTVVWLIQVFEDDALQGRLSPFLLQPLSPLWRYLAAHFSEQASRIPFVAVMLLVVGLAVENPFRREQAEAMVKLEAREIEQAERALEDLEMLRQLEPLEEETRL